MTPTPNAVSPITKFAQVPWGRLAYTEHGHGTDVVVLLHQFLVDKRAQWPIADYLAARGFRVICVDLPGHGESDHPRSADAYGIPRSAEAVLSLLDFLQLDQIFLGGASFGSLNALRLALIAPERFRGLWLEMPILDRSVRNSCYFGGPLLVGYSLLAPLLRLVAPVARRWSRHPGPLGMAMSLLARDPIATRHMMVGILGQGLKPWTADWRSLKPRTLIMGHPHDPVHVLADAEEMSKELPTAQFIRASSIVALRSNPEQLMPKVAEFIARCFPQRAADLAS